MSTIDHFISNDALFNSVVEAGVIHSGENTSNHSPIFVKLSLDIDTKVTEFEGSRKKVSWGKSTNEAREKYLVELNERFSQLHIPDCVLCRDVHCSGHEEQIEDYTIDILETVESVAEECLAHSGGVKHKTGKASVIPGWSDQVKPYSEESRFWFAVQQSDGKPGAGSVHDAMIYSKR